MLPFGYKLHGEVEPVDGSTVRTQFLVVGWVPVMPIASWYGGTVVAHQSLAGRAVEYVSEETEHGVRRTLHGRSVVFGQLRGGGAVAAAVIVVLLVMQLGEAPPWGQDATVALFGALAAIVGALVASVPLGRHVDPRDAAIRRAIGRVIGVAADLAAVEALDARRWRLRLDGLEPGLRTTLPRWRRIADGAPATPDQLALALAQVRLELATPPTARTAELEALTDRLLVRIAGPIEAPAPSGPEVDDEQDDDDADLPTDPAALVALLNAGDGREAAAEGALVDLGATAAPLLVAALDDPERETGARIVLKMIGALAAPALLEGVRTGSLGVAEDALGLLRGLKAGGTTAALLERHRRTSDLSLPDVARDLAKADPEAFAVLRAAATAAPTDVLIARALLHVDADAGVPILLDLARQLAAAAPEAAAGDAWSCAPFEAFLEHPTALPVAPFVAALSDPLPGLCRAAYDVLTGSSDPAAVAAVEAYEASEEESGG